jgi:Zn-dependent protease with chaperone function
VPFVVVISVAQFGLVALVAAWHPLLALAGVGALRDPASLPLFELLEMIVGIPFGLLTAWFTRVLERQADLEALELLGDPGAFMDIWRRLTSKNLGDLEPSWYNRAKGDHPVDCERMAFGKAWAEMNRVPIVEPTQTEALGKPEAPSPQVAIGAEPAPG